MKEFLDERQYYDFLCHRISREKAMKFLEPYYDTKSRGLELNNDSDMICMRKSIYDWGIL